MEARRLLLRLCLWLALLAGVGVALLCLNSVLFHLWAAYVPPQETEWHLRAALWKGAAFAIAVASVAFVGRLLYTGRPRTDRDRRSTIGKT